mmetsp:Transcript_9114/g.14317  ORF Transcript_9114/g.14317 Transcript_9114/m.14317 type:complete len:205 (+) Transcript_9114:664-1278(+)
MPSKKPSFSISAPSGAVLTSREPASTSAFFFDSPAVSRRFLKELRMASFMSLNEFLLFLLLSATFALRESETSSAEGTLFSFLNMLSKKFPSAFPSFLGVTRTEASAESPGDTIAAISSSATEPRRKALGTGTGEPFATASFTSSTSCVLQEKLLLSVPVPTFPSEVFLSTLLEVTSMISLSDILAGNYYGDKQNQLFQFTQFF